VGTALRGWVRGRVRRTAWGLAASAAIVALLGGLALACAAGARRTASAYGRYQRTNAVSDLSVNSGLQDPDALLERTADLPQVRSARTFVAFNALIDRDVSMLFEAVGSVDGRYLDQDRLALVSGRLPDPTDPDEVVVNEAAADLYRLRTGDTLDVDFFTDEQVADPSLDPATAPAAAHVEPRITGVGVFPDEVAQDESDEQPRILFTPALTRAHLDVAAYEWQGLRLERGRDDVPAVRTAYGRLLAEHAEATGQDVPPGYRGNVQETGDLVDRVQRAVRPHSVALGLFGAVIGLAAVVLGAQATGRHVRDTAEDQRVLSAMGVSRRALVPASTAMGVLPVVAGALGAIAVAFVLSPLAPIGPVRRIEPDPGFTMDAVAVVGGAVVLLLVLSTAATATALRSSAAARRDDAATVPTASSRTARLTRGLPAPARVGVSFANAARPVAVAAVVGVAAVVAALTFGSSLRHLVDTPRLYGWTADAVLFDDGGYGSIDTDAASALLAEDGDVEGWAAGRFDVVSVEGRSVPAMSFLPLRGDLAPPVLEGRGLQGPDEVVAGSRTLERLGLSVGDTVELEVAGETAQRRIVGRATLPAIGIVHGARTSLGDGFVLAATPPDAADDPDDDPMGFSAVFVRFREGVDAGAGRDRLLAAGDRLGSYPGSLDVIGVQRPAEITQHGTMRSSPAFLAGALAVAVLGSLLLALAASARRRRRDLALLKVLGLTSRSVGRVIQVQSGATMAVGLLVGIPLGVAGGQWAWRTYAEQLDVRDVATVPLGLVGLVVVAATVLAVVVAAGPAFAARRASIEGLRPE
jgi:putative ABC transport system permease protein